MTIDKSEEDEKRYHQVMLRLFTKNLRNEKNWSIEDLANALGVKVPSIRKMEGKSNPSPFINYVMEIKKLASLAEIGADDLMAILLGKRNEINEENVYVKNLARQISELDGLTQVKIKELISSPKRATQIIDTCVHLNKAPAFRLNLHNLLTKLSDDEAKSILGVVRIITDKAD